MIPINVLFMKGWHEEVALSFVFVAIEGDETRPQAFEDFLLARNRARWVDRP